MDKDIRVYRAETKKPRTEFTGFMRMFEPIRNLAITVGSFVVVITLVFVFIIIQAEEASRFRLDNWNTSFETWREAWEYVNNQDNYDIDDGEIEILRLSNDDNYYNLNGSEYVTVDQTISGISQRAFDKDEWSTGYSDVELNNGITQVDGEYYSSFNSYKAYDSADGEVVYSEFDAITSYLDISRSDFEYDGFSDEDVEVVYENYKSSVVLKFESTKNYNFNEYISTAGEHTRIINHLGWKISSEDFINDIFYNVHAIESELKTRLPIDFYNKTIWSDDRFGDGNFTAMFDVWKDGDETLVVDDYLNDEQSDIDYESWEGSVEQINRKAWNCDDYSAHITIDNCDFTSEVTFNEDLKLYLEEYYADIQNIKEVDTIIPYINDVPQLSYLNNLITDVEIMERVYLSDLIEDRVISNDSTYEFYDGTYPGIDRGDDWSGAVLYETALEWFKDNLNEDGWKYSLKADVLSGIDFDTILGSSNKVSRFENFNGKGEVLIYDTNQSLVDLLMIEGIENNTGISLIEAISIDRFYRLDIEHDNDDSFKSVNLIDVINHWKSELNKNKP